MPVLLLSRKAGPVEGPRIILKFASGQLAKDNYANLFNRGRNG